MSAPAFLDSDALAAEIVERSSSSGHPIVVGVSGYGGSGKSTLARQLIAQIPGAIRMRGDDFLDPARSHQRSPDWSGVDRPRLRDDVLVPFRARRSGVFQRFDWSTRTLSAPEAVPRGDIMIVDLIGLFHPEILDEIDMTIWCEVDLETAGERGMARDAALGRDHEQLWRDVWIPNERDFERSFRPREAANFIVTSAR